MTEKNNQLDVVKSLIKKFYNSTENDELRTPLLKAYNRLEDGADVGDIAAHAASAVNYLRKADNLTLSSEQEDTWRQLRDMGTADVLYHDPKNNLLNLDEM
ncbi:bacteriocin immunity protein [Companilactobacillus mishanensis]|uniref:Bacteriocin immunity protein n=1 Tax=Companilactobacillus mishanensis TaxID=2486008 RepID=A0A5P0ZK40_9LACO|nr:bacteriocin immunity protein [Companilactobacillus mishanensis]MQS53460.1 bacteriocin immunity protein [Companilactobacillus mishanensis]